MTEDRNNTLIWVIGVLVALCCICAIVIPLGGYLYFALAEPTFLANEPFFFDRRSHTFAAGSNAPAP